jgi:lipopolysaccharide transport system ATP-binding protein
VGITQFYEDPLVPGAVYPALYIPHSHFETVLHPDVNQDSATIPPSSQNDAKLQNWHNYRENQSPHIEFVVIRDLRDTLVSLYFSLKVSHPLIAEQLVQERNTLNEMSLDEGLLLLLENRMGDVAEIQRSWLPVCEKERALLVRYEDLLADEQTVFARIIDYCQLDISPQNLREIVARNSFESRTGRHKGEEDTSSHYRKGIVGDWRNVFSPKVISDFKLRFGDVLIRTGYEKDLNW